MEQYKRSATCGELGAHDDGRKVTLNGWVHRTRDHGGVHFFDLRDRYGIMQIVVDADAPGGLADQAASLKLEYCVAVIGTVRMRPEAMRNREMQTGEIELAAEQIVLLAKSDTLPFMIEDRSDAKDELRMKYRYLDLRSFSMQRKIALRHETSFRIREFLTRHGFLEIETPTMIRSTPEGARDFLIPSRLHRGKFYAMPQSPQLFKQILMVGGFDKYFQIAHCFRDEDARGDRQIEHTQIDIEMSFVSKEDVFETVEAMLAHVFSHALGVHLQTPFKRLTYEEAMNTYGSDKPELRVGLEITDFAAIARESSFQVFRSAITDGGAVKALVIPGGAEYSRKRITELEDVAKTYGAKGLAWMRVAPGESGAVLDGGVSKFFSDDTAAVVRAVGATPGDLIVMVADSWRIACTALGAVRLDVARREAMIARGTFEFAWVIDFPLFEWNDDEQKWDAAHHMFSMPQQRFIENLESDPGAVKGDLYDLVCNGFELASGSIRIHDPELQRRVFSIIGFDEQEAHRRFGFLLEAFQYGPPPHGGIAPGLDRLVMIMAEETSIREVIAFPKNTQGVSLMDDSPAEVDPGQLAELGLKIIDLT